MAAGYTTSLLVNAQAILSAQMQAPEFRTKNYGVTRSLLNNASMLLPELQAIKTSDSRTVETFLKEKTTISTAAARTYAPSGSFGDTQTANLSFTTTAAVAKTSLKVADRNIFTASELLAGEIMSAHIAIADAIETANVAYLGTNKTQVNLASSGYDSFGAWDSTNYVWNIPNGSMNYMFQYIKQIMLINKYDEAIDLFCDPVSAAIARQLVNQGGSNAQNTSFQFSGLNIIESVDITNEAGVTGTCYAVPQGKVGLVDWIPAANRAGVVTNDYKYGTIQDMAGMGVTYALFESQAGTDSNTAGAEVQDVNYFFESSIDTAPVKALLSTANETPIYKFQLQST